MLQRLQAAIDSCGDLQVTDTAPGWRWSQLQVFKRPVEKPPRRWYAFGRSFGDLRSFGTQLLSLADGATVPYMDATL